MERLTRIFLVFSIFLIIGVYMSGCSDNPDSPPSDTIAATTAAGPLYTAGDIVRSATGTESPAWLVVSYDAAGDAYTRALIYKNTDGSYGYRTGPATEVSKRAMLERVYTIKITHIAVEGVPIGAPTTVTTAVTTIAASATTTRTPATTTSVATTIKSTARPSIKGMNPEEGEAGTSVTTEITGSDFVSNLTAQLRRSGEDNIQARTISWYSASSVTCIFELPNTTKVGSWDIVVTNPNGLSGEKTNYFTVHGNGTSWSKGK
jgi:hypothetical protein